MRLRYVAATFLGAYGPILAVVAYLSGDSMIISSSPAIWLIIGTAQGLIIATVLHVATHQKDWPGGLDW